jgi:hypothetical protein
MTTADKVAEDDTITRTGTDDSVNDPNKNLWTQTMRFTKDNRLGIGVTDTAAGNNHDVTHGLTLRSNTQGTNSIMRLTSADANDNHIRFDYPSDKTKYWLIGVDKDLNLSSAVAGTGKGVVFYDAVGSKLPLMIHPDEKPDGNAGGSGVSINRTSLRNSTSPNLRLDVDGGIKCGNEANLSPSSTGDGHFMIGGSGYQGYATLDGTAMYIGHNSASRDLILQTDETNRVVIKDGGAQNESRVGIGTDSPAGGLHVSSPENYIITSEWHTPVVHGTSDDSTFTWMQFVNKRAGNHGVDGDPIVRGGGASKQAWRITGTDDGNGSGTAADPGPQISKNAALNFWDMSCSSDAEGRAALVLKPNAVDDVQGSVGIGCIPFPGTATNAKDETDFKGLHVHATTGDCILRLTADPGNENDAASEASCPRIEFGQDGHGDVGAIGYGLTANDGVDWTGFEGNVGNQENILSILAGNDSSRAGIAFGTAPANPTGWHQAKIGMMMRGGDQNVGIGGAPIDNRKLSVTGDIQSSANIYSLSDIRVKDDIKPIAGALDKVQNLTGVSYTRNDIVCDDRMIGLIAQDVEKVLPEVVSTTHGELPDAKSISYDNIVALLIEAIKEQQQQIDELKKSK